jgi:Fic family protein
MTKRPNAAIIGESCDSLVGFSKDKPPLRQSLYILQESLFSLQEEQEVVNLWKAMEFLDQCAIRKLPITEDLIKKLHEIIQGISGGRRPVVSEYRKEQNKVAEERTRALVYLPPEYQDVPILMEDLVAWVNQPEQQQLPAPIKAGIFLWQFLTIHPYIDGNGRTARSLATYILRQQGLWLKGLFVLESYYDRNLDGYYRNIQMGLHHNYYFGRNDCDLTPWLNFFIDGLAEVFQEAAELVKQKSQSFLAVEPDLLRKLDSEQKIVFAQLAYKTNVLTTTDIGKLLGLGERSVRVRIKKWRADSFVRPRDDAPQRIRSIILTPEYEEVAQTIRENPDKFRYLFG